MTFGVKYDLINEVMREMTTKNEEQNDKNGKTKAVVWDSKIIAMKPEKMF